MFAIVWGPFVLRNISADGKTLYHTFKTDLRQGDEYALFATRATAERVIAENYGGNMRGARIVNADTVWRFVNSRFIIANGNRYVRKATPTRLLFTYRDEEAMRFKTRAAAQKYIDNLRPVVGGFNPTIIEREV